MKHLKIIFLFLILLPEATQGQVDYTTYERILKQTVSSNGQVNYKGIKDNYQNDLNGFLTQLSSVSPSQLNKNQKLAFWINVYNAFTIKLILDHWPVKSIQDISNGHPWGMKWIKIDGTTYSLDQIENEVIRPTFDEPRIHFAINCAAVSCPPLLDEPYSGELLDKQLNERTRAFINNKKYNQLTKSAITISRIFDWYQSDFEGIIVFINKYADITINQNASIRYMEYNWRLNN